jgi:glycerate kinase
LNTTSFGLGEMMKDAITRGCNKLIVGIGGSATNDAGIGMLMALGYSFKDSAGQSLDGIGSDLSKVTDILSPAITDTYRHVSITVASDVDNPLYGQKGAAFVFGPQKGANALMVSQLNSGLQHFAQIVSSSVGKNCAFEKGSGAAGGVGYAFKCFFNNCKFISGIEFILDYIDFDRIVNGANLIITGEGKIDNQTMMGKVAIGVLKRAVQKNIPVIAIAGKVEDKSDLMQKGFKDIVCINPDGISNEEALKKDYACSNIKETVGKLLRTNHF